MVQHAVDNDMPKVLTEQQIKQFWDDGYVFPFDCLSTAEARELRNKLEAYEGTDPENARQRIRGKAHLAFPWFFELVHHPKILDAVEDLIGPNILIYISTLWFKSARDPGFVSWHQDSAYYGLDPHDVITLWFGITDSNRSNGCVRVIPGSHLAPDRNHVETYAADNMLARGQTIEDIDESQAVDLEVAAGQFSMHHERMIHGSLGNPSDDRRLGVSFTYMPTYVRSVVGRHSAVLVRGEDTHRHWDADPAPRYDLDPVALAAIQHWFESYRDAANRRQEFDRETSA